MLSNLGARLNLLSRFANSTSIKRRVIQKQYLCESNGSIFSRVTSAYFSTTGVCKDKSTKEDNRRSLFMHRMQKKINHEDFEGALGVYRKLRSLRLDDHVGVFNKLFNLAIAQDDPTKIEQVLNEMNAANVLPISKTLEILFPYLIQKDMRVHVLKLADQMKKHHIPIREIEIQESLAEYLKRAPKEEELPKKEKSTKKKAKETEEEEKPKKKPMTVISSEKQLKKEVEKYLQSNKDAEADGSLKKKKSSDKKSTKKSDKKQKEDEEDDDEDQHEKKITKKGNSINIKEKSVKTEVDKEGKTKKITKAKSETVIEDKKAKKDQKKYGDDKESNKKQKVIEEDEFDDEEFDDDDFDDDEVIEKVEKKKTKKITKSGVKKVKKTVKKVKKVSTK